VQGGEHQPDRFVPGIVGAVAKMHRPASLKRLTAQRSQSRTVTSSSVAPWIMVNEASSFTPARAGVGGWGLEREFVDARQRFQVGDGDAFVELVDAGIDRAEFDQLRADVGDEAAVRGAAGGGKFGGDAGCVGDGGGQRLAEFAARRQEGLGAQGPGDVVLEPWRSSS
jgi:hypothetical protein